MRIPIYCLVLLFVFLFADIISISKHSTIWGSVLIVI